MHGKLYVSDPKLWEQTFKDMVSGKLNPYHYARSPQTVIYHSIVANIYLLAQLTCRHVTKSNTTGAIQVGYLQCVLNIIMYISQYHLNYNTVTVKRAL